MEDEILNVRTKEVTHGGITMEMDIRVLSREATIEVWCEYDGRDMEIDNPDPPKKPVLNEAETIAIGELIMNDDTSWCKAYNTGYKLMFGEIS